MQQLMSSTGCQQDTELIRELEQWPYICCLTAYTHQSYKEAAMGAGMNDFINKPMSYDVLHDLLVLNKVI